MCVCVCVCSDDRVLLFNLELECVIVVGVA